MGQMAKIFLKVKLSIKMCKHIHTSTLEPHAKLMKLVLDLRMRLKVLKAIGNSNFFSELKSKQQFFSKFMSNGLLF